MNNKFALLLIGMVFSINLFSQTENGKQKEDKYCFKCIASFVNPFLQENSFERIGSILSFRGGFAYKLGEKKYIGLEGATSLFFPKGGGAIGEPEVLPQLKFEFTNTDRVITLLTIGQLYNPSLGFQADLEIILSNPKEKKFIFSNYFLGINQTFDLKPGEDRVRPPNSWLAVSGLQFVKPMKNKWLFVAKAGIGARGDSDENTKFTGNLEIVLRWHYVTAVAQYTNAVPDRGFPNYFVSVLSLDLTKIWRQHISNRECNIGSYIMGY